MCQGEKVVFVLCSISSLLREPFFELFQQPLAKKDKDYYLEKLGDEEEKSLKLTLKGMFIYIFFHLIKYLYYITAEVRVNYSLTTTFLWY